MIDAVVDVMMVMMLVVASLTVRKESKRCERHGDGGEEEGSEAKGVYGGDFRSLNGV